MKTSDALEIEVSNFGPIVEANVDLRAINTVCRTKQHRQVLSSHHALYIAPPIWWIGDKAVLLAAWCLWPLSTPCTEKSAKGPVIVLG